jgi:hypothetical protein
LIREQHPYLKEKHMIPTKWKVASLAAAAIGGLTGVALADDGEISLNDPSTPIALAGDDGVQGSTTTSTTLLAPIVDPSPESADSPVESPFDSPASAPSGNGDDVGDDSPESPESPESPDDD